MYKIIDGKKLASELRLNLKNKIGEYIGRRGEIGLAVILVGETPHLPCTSEIKLKRAKK